MLLQGSVKISRCMRVPPNLLSLHLGWREIHLYPSLNSPLKRGISAEPDAHPDNVRPELVPLGDFIFIYLRKVGALSRREKKKGGGKS
ncbi:hypothetical protein CEXT_130061 [Caerostris extrusa]|uniref:Uncharacterized protein n=1 Tax=Caerostris extrusa TaxID=172846 RepID=A0AAV4QWA1_CAEEX|nr:hypothetical protein CEXT_130061 [Caerostris extrusa]